MMTALLCIAQLGIAASCVLCMVFAAVEASQADRDDHTLKSLTMYLLTVWLACAALASCWWLVYTLRTVIQN